MFSTLLCRHLQVHKGPVWTALIKKDVLISGSHDHSVGTGLKHFYFHNMFPRDVVLVM